MPKSVTAVTAAHISMLIDSVRAVAGRAKPRLMGEGMSMIVWGCCQPGSRCTWSVEQESTWADPFASFLWLDVTHTLYVPAIIRKGNGYREEGYSIHPFGGTWCNQWWQSGMMEQWLRQCKDLDRGIVYRGRRKENPPTVTLWENQSLWLLFSLKLFSTVPCGFHLFEWELIDF